MPVPACSGIQERQLSCGAQPLQGLLDAVGTKQRYRNQGKNSGVPSYTHLWGHHP